MVEIAAWLYVYHDSRIDILKGRVEPGALYFNFYADIHADAYPHIVSKYEKVVDMPLVAISPFVGDQTPIYSYFWMKTRDDELAKEIFKAYFESRIAKLDEYMHECVVKADENKKVFKNAIFCVDSIDILGGVNE